MKPLQNVINRLRQIQNPVISNNTLAIGFNSLNQILNGGFANGNLYLIGAKESIGNTTLLVNFILHLISINNKAGIITLDLTPERFVERIVSCISGIGIDKISTGNLTKVELDQVCCPKLSSHFHNLFINDSCDMNIDNIKQTCEVWIQQGTHIIFIDSLLHIKKDHTTLAFLSKKLKEISTELNIPIVTTCRLIKQSPILLQLQDLRKLGAIEESTDVILFLYRPEYFDMPSENKQLTNEGKTYLRIAKNDGILGTIEFKTFLNIQKFIENPNSCKTVSFEKL